MRKAGRRVIVAPAALVDPSLALDPLLPPNTNYLFVVRIAHVDLLITHLVQVEVQRIKRGSKAAPEKVEPTPPLPSTPYALF